MRIKSIVLALVCFAVAAPAFADKYTDIVHYLKSDDQIDSLAI